jgi:hypothetical protein
MSGYLFPRTHPTTPRKHDVTPQVDTSCDPGPVVTPSATIGVSTEEEGRVSRDLLLENLRWLAAGNPEYAGTEQEGRQNVVVAHLMADDFLLSYMTIRRLPNSSARYAKGIRREGAMIRCTCGGGSSSKEEVRSRSASVAISPRSGTL